MIDVYSRPGCHLCEDVIEQLEILVKNRTSIEVHNVDMSTALAKRYGSRVPVVCVQGEEVCHFHLDREALDRALRRAEAVG